MKLKKTTECVIYTRVSSEKQVENYSLDFQEKSLRKYAESNHMKVMKVFREEGHSATNINRPAYKEMIQYLEEHETDVILVHKLDRLHRDENNMFSDIKRFKESKIRVIAVADGIDTSDDSATLAMAVLTAIGANFSRNLSKETRKGLISAAENCLHTGGKPPYGYKINHDTMMLEIDETTAPAVKKIFQLYAENFRISEIIEWLKENGYKTSKGNDFKANSLNDILHNEKYKGCYTWDKSASKDSDGKRNGHKHKDQYIRIEGGCPAIVSEEIFDQVQKRLAENADRAGNRIPDRYYPLTGMIFCTCGSPMCGGVSYSKGRRYHKYNCIGKCGNKSIRADYLEAFVLNAITTCIFSESNKTQLISELNTLSKTLKQDSDREYQQLKSKLSGLETSHENLLQALEKGKARKSILNRLERIEQQKQQTDLKIQNLIRESHQFTESDLLELQQSFSEYLQVRNSINNKYFLKNVIDRIEVDDESVQIMLKGGISIDKSTKIMMKGNDSMIKRPVGERITAEGILLSIGSSEEKGCIDIKIALSIESPWSFGNIVDISVPREYLYTIAKQLEKELHELVGIDIEAKLIIHNGEIKKIQEITAK